MKDYKTTLLCSHQTQSDILVSLVSGKADMKNLTEFLDSIF